MSSKSREGMSPVTQNASKSATRPSKIARKLSVVKKSDRPRDITDLLGDKSMRRLALRAGVGLFNMDVWRSAELKALSFAKELMYNARITAKGAKRNTIRHDDIRIAARIMGYEIVGWPGR